MGDTNQTEAGVGEHRVYRIRVPSGDDTARLTCRHHYVGVDAVAWFINKQSSFFKDRMASGTLEIKLASGLEEYEVALGTFELQEGAKTAPVFEKPVLPDRNYRGGVLTFSATLTGIKRDNAVAGLLKSAANASLGIAAGMVDTATLAGPAKLLATAGSDILGGVRTLLQETGEKLEPLFDFSGLEFNLKPEDVAGPQLYLLFHRGSKLDESKLSIRQEGELKLPFYDEAVLGDGAWLLLRVRRADEYSGVRQWFDATRKFRHRAQAIVSDFGLGMLSKEDAMKEFSPSSGRDKTLADEFIRLRGVISSDAVISEREASLHISQLRLRIESARQAITKEDSNVYHSAIDNAAAAISRGAGPAATIASSMAEEAAFVADERVATIVADTPYERVGRLDQDALFPSFQYMPHLLNEYASDVQV